MTRYAVDFTDTEGARRIVHVTCTYDLTSGQYQDTMAAFYVDQQWGYVIRELHSVKVAPIHPDDPHRPDHSHPNVDSHYDGLD